MTRNDPAASQASAADLADAVHEALIEAGHVPHEMADTIITLYRDDVTPAAGARVVARAWVDGPFRDRLFQDGTAAASELGIGGPEGEQVVFVENTETVHNVIVCTQCSCTAWPLLGLPPDWYKSFAYRSRVVREARSLLAELGLELPESTEIRVWDTSGDVRYVVLPLRPAGTDDLSEGELAGLVTREAMIGVAHV